MKRFIAVCITVVFILSLAATAFAASVTTGWLTTSGGTQGTCSVRGILNYLNSTSAGGDCAQAVTESGARGKLGARAVVWYTDAGGNTSTYKETILANVIKVTTEKTYAASGCHGYKVSSGHTYESDDYGSWTRGLSKIF